MNPCIEVRNLKKYFDTPSGQLHAVDDISFKIEKGTTMGVVGESGCGKSTLGRTMIRLYDATAGKIFLDGEDVTNVKGRHLKKVRERMQMIFQDPYSSINPRLTISTTIREPLLLSKRFSRKELDYEVDKIMDKAGIEMRLRNAYPHELDGGRRQRVGIARALALEPEFIVCDEPVSALDVSIQAQILNLLMDLSEKDGLTLMFVTHDLSVVRHISQNICVMYLGQLVETGPTEQLFEKPLHPYTKALLSAIPSVDIDNPSKRIILKGELVSPVDPKPGCRFAARCPYAREQCRQPQPLKETQPGHFVACHRAQELDGEFGGIL